MSIFATKEEIQNELIEYNPKYYMWYNHTDDTGDYPFFIGEDEVFSSFEEMCKFIANMMRHDRTFKILYVKELKDINLDFSIGIKKAINIIEENDRKRKEKEKKREEKKKREEEEKEYKNYLALRKKYEGKESNIVS